MARDRVADDKPDNSDDARTFLVDAFKVRLLDLLKTDPEVRAAVVETIKTDPTFTFPLAEEMRPECFRSPHSIMKRRT